MTPSSIDPYGSCDNAIRYFEHEGQTWFLASDVCTALDLGNVSASLRRLDYDHKAVHINPDFPDRKLLIVSEPGLYTLIMSCRHASIKPLKKWLINKVIKSEGFTFEELFSFCPNNTQGKRRLCIEKRREPHRRRRSKISAIETDVTPEKITMLKALSKGKCYWCGKKAKTIHLDHITPLAKGGEHMMYNLVVSCAKCNCTKNADDPQKWGVLC